MSLANILGKGIMPNFGMRGVQSSPFTNVSKDMLSTAAAGEVMRQQISDKYDSDLDAFYDGTASLKDIFGTKEPSIEDLISEEDDMAFDVNLPINDAPLTYSDAGLTEAPLGTVPEEEYGIKEGIIDAVRYGMFPYLSALTEPTDLADGTLYGDDFENAPPEVLEALNYVDGYADGGRVHKGFGGTIMNNLSQIIPSQAQQQMQQTFTPNRLVYGYSPFMDAQQGFDYYTQFQAPTYPIQQAVPVPNVPGEGEDRGFSNITLPVEPGNSFINEKEDFGTLSAPVKGGGENRPLSRFEANPTTMGFNDQGKVVYTNVNPYTKNVKVGDEVPFVSPIAYGLGYLADKATNFVEKTFVPESVKAYFGKKKVDAAPMTPTKRPNITASPSGPVTPGQSMAMVGNTSLAGMSQAQAKQAMEQGFSTGYDAGQVDPGFSKALQNTSSKKSTNLGTGKYSDGNVSGYTGGPQSPHSSMSTANNKIGNVKGQPKGGFTANQISKGKLVGYGFDPKTGKYKGAVQTKHGPLVSDPTKNKKLQALKNKFGKNKNNKGGKGGNQGGKQGQSRCFVKGTMVEMADGTTKEITTITPGMETRGGTVEFVLQGLPVDIWDYKGVKVSGTHWVVEDNQLIAVEDSKHGIKTDMFEPVYSMKTSKQRMWIKGIEFGDFESGTDEDWEPYFEKVRQDLNKKLHEKRKENQQSDERV
tara:strand:+ start:1250 stop:3346 length:2097 start_codon:yes stop_codon:yes gene_type:complete